MKFTVMLSTDEDGWILAEVPTLPGCLSQGRTREEALGNIRDAIKGWIHVRLMREQGNLEIKADNGAVEKLEIEV
ncbi:type II toxin-antitoxin system HicB family antitoxin [bacterium]|nr:type II toxin-antitoxin system HicB family antitoxin [bacterium]